MRNKRHPDKKPSATGGAGGRPPPRPHHHYHHPPEGLTADRFTPRAFQVELLDHALRENTIVCLQTGSGKTFIAVMLIKELMSKSETVREPLAHGGKRAFFLVNTTPLVHQQKEAIERHTDLKVQGYVGEDGVDYWSGERWYEELDKFNVLVMTSQILLDILHHGFFRLDQANLLVFDECHSAVKDHPMRNILKFYDEVEVIDRPRILGLTASLLNSKIKFEDLERRIRNLEMSMRSCVRTASDHGQVEIYSTKPREHLVECGHMSTSCREIRESLDAKLAEALEFLDVMMVPLEENETDPRQGPKDELRKVQTILHELGPWPFYKMAFKAMNEANKNAECMPLMINMYLLKWLETYLRQMCAMCEDVFGEPSTPEDVMAFLSPKVVRVVECLREFAPSTLHNDVSQTDSGCESSASVGRTDVKASGADRKRVKDVARDASAEAAAEKLHLEVNEEEEEEMEEEEANPKPETVSDADGQAGLCGIVFVQHRIVAEALSKCLNHLKQMDSTLDFIRPRHLVGQNFKEKAPKVADENFEKEQQSASRSQEEVLRRFRSNDVNLLVATDILKEGIHVPKCNVIVMFSLPLTFNTFIQSKGRARAPKSRYIMLCNEAEKIKFADALDEYKQIEKVLRYYCNDRDQPEEDECDEHMAEDLLPAYIPERLRTKNVDTKHDEDEEARQASSPRVTLNSAISLVNRYCAKLPSDAFTHLTPKCETRMIDEEGRAIVTKAARKGERCQEGRLWVSSLRFPINSPLKDVVFGAPMPTKRLSQKAVALKACQLLHERGELDDHLLPLGKDIRVEGMEEDDTTEEERAELVRAAEDGTARPGSTKRRQHYNKKIAEMLSDGLPENSKPCSLYVLSMRLTCPISEAQNTRGRRIYYPESTTLGFGVLTCNSLPFTPGFPIYSRSGEVMVEVVLVDDNVVMPEDQYCLIVNFHKFVFSSVLRLEKDPMQFNPKKAPSKYFVVPLQMRANGELGSKDCKIEAEIDWKFIEQVKETVMELKNRFNTGEHPLPGGFVDVKKYDDAVVMPWYRNMDQPHYFYVAELCANLNPRSAFPSGEYDTFYEYYYSKYGLEILDKEQPLLDVDHTSLRLNLLTPRYMNHKGVMLPTSSAETKKAKRENLQQKQILVPELCDIHPFPAPLWRKAVCLPAILYRINSLLIAEQLRKEIAEKACIGVVQLPEEYPFPHMDFGWGKRNEEDVEQQLCIKGNEPSKKATAEPAITRDVDSEYDDDDDDSDDDLDEKERAKRRLKRTTAKYQKSTGETVTSTRQLIHDPLAVIAEQGIQDDYPEGAGTGLGSHRDPYLDDEEDESFSDDDGDFPDSPFNFGRNGFCHGGRSHGDGIANDFVIGTWDPNEASTAAPSWIPSPRPPLSFAVGEEGDASPEKPPKESMPEISFGVPAVDSPSSTVKIDTWEDISRDMAGSGEAGMGWNDAQGIAITARGTRKVNEAPPASTNGASQFPGYSDDEDMSSLSDDDGLGLAAGDELMILDSGMGDFNLAFLGETSNLNAGNKIETKLNGEIPATSGKKKKNKKGKGIGKSKKDSSLPSPPLSSIASFDYFPPAEESDEEAAPVVDASDGAPSRSQAGAFNHTDPLASGSVRLLSHSEKIIDVTEENGTEIASIAPTLKDDASFSHNSLDRSYVDSKAICDTQSAYSESSIKSHHQVIHNSRSNEEVMETERTSFDTNGRPTDGKCLANFSKGTAEPMDILLGATSKLTVNIESGCDKGSEAGPLFVSQSMSSTTQSSLPLFSLDVQVPLETHPGPSPCLILQALTMSNSNDGFNLERLEMIGDSFLKQAVTTFLYCSYPQMHEGRLSFFRSKQVSNYNLYKLGKRKGLQECMIATKFEPSENWLPPGFSISQDRAFPIAKWAVEMARKEAEKAAKAKLKGKGKKSKEYSPSKEGQADQEATASSDDGSGAAEGADQAAAEISAEQTESDEPKGGEEAETNGQSENVENVEEEAVEKETEETPDDALAAPTKAKDLDFTKLHATLYKDTDIEHLPYILQIQHTLPDKSIADCVEALIGCYLTECGPRGALLLMAWLGLRVLPKKEKVMVDLDEEDADKLMETGDADDRTEALDPAALTCALIDKNSGPLKEGASWMHLPRPPSPLLNHPKSHEKLENLLTGFVKFEEKIEYKFRDRAYLLQAFTHASYHYNDITDCYQRLEFLGDAVLDYVITRHLYEDERKHSPGELTDLRSALVNNNIFAALAVRYDYHKYFKALSVGLFQVIEKYVSLQANCDITNLDQFANVPDSDDDSEDKEETEVPKALGDVFESVAGAIFLDSGFSYDAVWRVYYKMMRPLIDQYSAKVPKSPVRELLEMEPETAKFEKPERTLDGRIRVTVNVIGKGKWKGVGRNYRIAKCACAKKALKALKLAEPGSVGGKAESMIG